MLHLLAELFLQLQDLFIDRLSSSVWRGSITSANV